MTDAAKDTEVSERMAIDMYGCWYQDVCTHKLPSAPIVFGGPGVISLEERLQLAVLT